jgi:hypothetical protein
MPTKVTKKGKAMNERVTCGHDFEHLLNKTKKPSKAQIEKAERGERAEGVRDALKAGKGNAVAGAKKLRMKKPGLAKAEAMAKKMKAKK